MTIMSFNELALIAAKRARVNGLTQLDIALELDISQSQVSRILSGKSKRHTKLLDEICIFVNENMHDTTSELVKLNPEIAAAIDSVWDGSSNHARAIAEVIRSLGAFAKKSQIASNQVVQMEDAK